jgi:hypothetical protein
MPPPDLLACAHDTPVWIVSLGTERTFGLRETSKKGMARKFKPRHGSLITLPSPLNDSHQHAVLPDADVAGIRFAWNCKAMDDIYYLQDRRIPKVWCCKTGHKYLSDAIYVGCRTIRGRPREGSLFGNAVDPFKVRNAKTNPWLADNEADFRVAALKKMEDPAFRQQLEALRGKHLLCWCEQEGPRRAEFCHARVWLELANQPGAGQ